MVNKPPPSVTNNIFNATGLLTAFLCLYFFHSHKASLTTASIIAILGCYACPIILLEWLFLRVYRRPSTGLRWGQQLQPLSNRRILTKILGFVGTLGCVALFYWIFPEYHGSFYDPYWSVLKILLPILLIGAPFYIAYIDQRLENPEDELWQAGLFFTGAWIRIDWNQLRRYALGWLIKAFFLPLMLVYLSQNLSVLVAWSKGFNHFLPVYDFLWTSVFTVDLLVVSCGYIFSFRLIDSHIRTPNPYAKAWVAALLCYAPFSSLLLSNYLNYGSEEGWKNWFSHGLALQVLWGSCILILLGIYSYSSLNFGLRFSNLTHRGIITNGAYRYSKHPAYIAKNLSWWLSAMPFMGTGKWFETFRSCLLLLLVNLIYYVRAKTEELHLSKDPVYVAYAMYINENGLLAPFARRLPFLKYRPPSS